jgi:hypothetical protein
MLVLGAIFSYVCLQNFFKWLPFSPGRSANDLLSLQDNYPSIIGSLLLFATILLALARPVLKELKLTTLDYVVGAFCVFLFLQVAIRDSHLRELVRSCALFASISSSVLLGKYFAAEERRLRWLLTTLKWSLLFSTIFGCAVALIRPAAVNWGSLSGLACVGTMPCRAEFFFFSITPVILVSLLWRSFSRERKYSMAQLAAGFAVAVLALLTRTRQFMLTIAVSGLLSFMMWAKSRRSRLLTLLIGAIAVTLALAVIGFPFIKTILQYSRLVPEPEALALDPHSADWSSGRLQLLFYLWDLFRQAPIFGLGGDHVRELISHAPLEAKTEHGFAFYLAAYGCFGALFLIYIFWSFLNGLRTLFQVFIGRVPIESSVATVAVIALPLFLFGLFGIFGSATNPNDWLCLAFAAILAQSKPVDQAIR